MKHEADTQKVLGEENGSKSRILLAGAISLGLILVASAAGVFLLSSKSDATGVLTGLNPIQGFLIGLAALSCGLLVALYLFSRAAKRTAIAQERIAELEQRYDEQISAMAFAQAETDRIMETVQEGLFLVDEAGIIGEFHSREAPVILRQEELAGRSLFDILQLHLSEKMYKASIDFFGLLFNASRKERTILSVNPLTDVEVNFPNPDGGFITRYLGFSFRRILVDGKVDRLFVALRDVTKEVELQAQIRESDKVKEREMQVLLSVVHVPQKDLDKFVELAEEELNTINTTLRAEDFATGGGRNDVLRERLQTVYRSVHNLNGNAALLKLGYFQKSAYEFESKIKDLLSRRALTGDDFLSVVIYQAGLRDNLADLVNLRNQLGDLHVQSPDPQEGVIASALSAQLGGLVETISGELGKSAELTVDEYALQAFVHGRGDLIRDVLVQLIRNSVAHGVEKPEVREAAGKPATATISIHPVPAPAPGVYGLAVRDDGRGLDIESIRLQAVDSGLIEEGQDIDTDEVIQCIFHSGFSTSASADLHSGRGVGMDIVKSKFVDEGGGCIEVSTESGQFCEFRLYITL